MKFSILVKEGPWQHQAGRSALLFVEAAVALGHPVERVFFYHDGVHNASSLTTPPQDEVNLTDRWIALASVHRIDLVICVASAQRRGLLDEAEQVRLGKPSHNVASAFRIGGLGQLVEAAITADRLVSFGN